MSIGDPYDFDHYNCSHTVVEWYQENKGIDIEHSAEFSLSFIKLIMKNFHWVKEGSPVNGDMAIMKVREHVLHVGIYLDGYILHNFASGLEGQVVLTDPDILKEVTLGGIRYARPN